jgi:hypothetical protein
LAGELLAEECGKEFAGLFCPISEPIFLAFEGRPFYGGGYGFIGMRCGFDNFSGDSSYLSLPD